MNIKLNLNENDTRQIIDSQLREAGWEADTWLLRYSNGTRPAKGRNIAIAEWPTLSVVNGKGYADYALFIGLELVGILEAKKIDTDIFSVVDSQCSEYAKGIRPEDYHYCIESFGECSKWEGFHVPFLFASNGRKYFEQWETKSGIWFRDVRSKSKSRALRGWYSPEGLKQLLTRNDDEANNKLINTPVDILRDPDGLSLRPYQIKAIERIEEAIAQGKKTALMAMATGTGKTRTIIGMIYRFLTAGRFKRILFLVDRNALGEQAQDAFKNVKIEQLLPLEDIFIIRHLEERGFDLNSQIKISTVQSMMKHILEDENATVSEYDLIIVDEAHRGYMLDKEMSDMEILYRDENEYLSKYKMVIDYFDAVKIAMTATPALHTTEIFGKPVFTYSYREAVVDGWLCDQNPPHNIFSELRLKGIQYKKGDKLVKINPVTGEIINSEELEDDLTFEVDTFNKKIITRPFNKTVLQEISKYINPLDEGKTLIFAVSDEHADMIVDILRKIYGEQGIPSEAIRKITGSIGDRQIIDEAIKQFRNEKFPNIAVTVDLLTTGIDVPKICNLVFMRLVKSRILFEQMLGRATRKCNEINKEAFEVFDPVGVYDALEDFLTMKAVTTSESFEELISGLSKMTEPDYIKAQIEKIVAKIHRKARFFTKNAQEQFKDLTGYSIEDFALELQQLNENEANEANEAKELIIKNLAAFIQLDKDVKNYDGKYIDNRPDRIISHTQGYGDNQKPEDYINAFSDFIKTHVNDIEALKILVTRPSDLTKSALKSLRLELDRHNFNEKHLNGAWKAITNQEITADIIAFIRHYAINSQLISHEERIGNAFERLVREHDFNSEQLKWLNRIKETMLKEPVLDEGIFNDGAFKNYGGFRNIDRFFNGRLKDIIQELNKYFYDDAA